MKGIMQIVSFELNNQDLLEDWKKMSVEIYASLQNAGGFISRDSAVGGDGKIYCVLKWADMESQVAVKKKMESPEMEGEMKKFAQIANLQTMKEEFLEVL